MRRLDTVLAEAGEEHTPRQRLAISLSTNWGGDISETNYYINLFNRWMSIHGVDIIWFGLPSKHDRIPVKDLNSNGEIAERAYKKVSKMLYHWRSKQALEDHCYPTFERPWVGGKRIFIDIFDRGRQEYQCIRRELGPILRAISVAAKIEKLESRL